MRVGRICNRFCVPIRLPTTRQCTSMPMRQTPLKSGFRSEAGAQTFVVLRTVLSTARKQGWNILHSLTTTPDSLLRNLRTS
jgi:transposase